MEWTVTQNLDESVTSQEDWDQYSADSSIQVLKEHITKTWQK